MKKFALFIIVFVLTSCVTYTPLVSFVDYSSYNSEGIFLTESNSVSFKYEPVGSVNVILYSGFANEAKKAPMIEDKKEKGDDVYYSTNNGRLKYKDATIQEALRLAVENARNKGANAIINIRYEYVPAFKNNPDGWHMSGMAVKR